MTAGDAHFSEMRVVSLLAGDIAWRHPLGAGPGLHTLVAVHDVHILETESAGLVVEEPDDEGCGEVAAGKHVPKSVRDAVISEGGEETNQNWRSVSRGYTGGWEIAYSYRASC